MTARVRFAPSPTGFMHLGNARTALFNWLYARHVGGTFLLRIEDTDRERHTEAAVQVIYDSLRWLGLDWDEEVLFQSQRIDYYHALANELIDKGHAYRCTCTREELEVKKEKMRELTGTSRYDRSCRALGLGPDCGEHVVRFATPFSGSSIFDDLVQGTIRKGQEELDDFVMIRSDGMPTYQFAVVADDHAMDITHVLRGVDHIDNTHDQLNIYRAMGWEPPRFGHAPRILGLSKRKGSPSVEHYRAEMGLLREGLVNYLVRLGWSHGDQELFTTEELVAAFDFPGINKVNCNFDDVKLAWVNEQQLRRLPIETVAEQVLPYFEAAGYHPEMGPWFYRLLDTLRLRAAHLGDFVDRARFFFDDFETYEESAAKKHLKASVAPLLGVLADRLATLETWEEDAIEALYTEACEEHDIKLGKIAQPSRVALTGVGQAPGIYEIVWLLGRDRAVARLRKAVAWIEANRG